MLKVAILLEMQTLAGMVQNGKLKIIKRDTGIGASASLRSAPRAQTQNLLRL